MIDNEHKDRPEGPGKSAPAARCARFFRPLTGRRPAWGSFPSRRQPAGRSPGPGGGEALAEFTQKMREFNQTLDTPGAGPAQASLPMEAAPPKARAPRRNPALCSRPRRPRRWRRTRPSPSPPSAPPNPSTSSPARWSRATTSSMASSRPPCARSKAASTPTANSHGYPSIQWNRKIPGRLGHRPPPPRGNQPGGRLLRL